MLEIDAWKRVLFEPDKVFAEQKPKANTTVALVWVVILSIIFWSIPEMISGNMDYALAFVIVGVIGGLIAFFIMKGMWFFAKLLGGMGSFSEHAYLSAIVYFPILIIFTVLCLLSSAALNLIISVLPANNLAVSDVMIIPTIILVIYAIYLQVKVIKLVHDLSTGRSIIAFALPVILFALVLRSISSISLSMPGRM
jgi:hypothetical protein